MRFRTIGFIFFLVLSPISSSILTAANSAGAARYRAGWPTSSARRRRQKPLWQWREGILDLRAG